MAEQQQYPEWKVPGVRAVVSQGALALLADGRVAFRENRRWYVRDYLSWLIGAGEQPFFEPGERAAWAAWNKGGR